MNTVIEILRTSTVRFLIIVMRKLSKEMNTVVETLSAREYKREEGVI